jgi:hypothetical protein
MQKTIILALMLACESAQAAEPHWVTISGAGSISCGDAVQTLSARATNEQSKTDAFQIQNWVKGYIAAYNMRGRFDDPAHVRTVAHVTPPDEATIYLFVDTYCHKRPTAHVNDATDALIRAIGGVVYIPPGYE